MSGVPEQTMTIVVFNRKNGKIARIYKGRQVAITE
jgi:hypothetical protein